MSTQKVAIIIGAGSGIGLDAAIKFVNQGIYTIVASRNAVDQIKKATGTENIESLPLDLADLQSVRDFASTFIAKNLPLHILVLNAGAAPLTRTLTKDNIEMTFQTNHLGHFLLTHLLLDKLRASAPARIVVTSSYRHDPDYVEPLDDVVVNLDNFNFDNGMKYSVVKAYKFSKLLNLWFTYELNRRLEGSGVTINAFNPGWIPETDMIDDLNWFERKVLIPILIFFSDTRTVDHGGNCIVDLATDDKIQTTGKYFSDRKETPSAKVSYDVDSQKRLWEISEKLAGIAH